MPKPERGSLSVIKRALPNLPPAAPPRELENRLLSAPDAVEGAGAGTAMVREEDVQAATPQSVQPDMQTAGTQDVPLAAVHQMDADIRGTPATRLVPRPGRRKEPVQMVTYRIPASLYDRLLRTAEYNNLNMTDIVVEAIERHLPNFPDPGDSRP